MLTRNTQQRLCLGKVGENVEGIAYVNDTYMPIETAGVSIEDRGFQFGDGVYEVIKAYRGIPFALEAHLNRLERSSRMLDLPLPKDRGELKELISEALHKSGFCDAIIYLQVTRGWAPRAHAFPDNVKPTFILTVRKARSVPGEMYEHGASAITVPDERWLRCDIKSICLLPNILAREKANRAGAYDSILVREDGRVTEGTSSNVFAARSGRLYTPPEGRWILSGVTRAIVLDLVSQEGITVVRDFFDTEFLMSADEVFLTNTSVQVMPIVTIDEQPIGCGKPGTVTQRVMELFEAEVLRRTRQS